LTGRHFAVVLRDPQPRSMGEKKERGKKRERERGNIFYGVHEAEQYIPTLCFVLHPGKKKRKKRGGRGGEGIKTVPPPKVSVLTAAAFHSEPEKKKDEKGKNSHATPSRTGRVSCCLLRRKRGKKKRRGRGRRGCQAGSEHVVFQKCHFPTPAYRNLVHLKKRRKKKRGKGEGGVAHGSVKAEKKTAVGGAEYASILGQIFGGGGKKGGRKTKKSG